MAQLQSHRPGVFRQVKINMSIDVRREALIEARTQWLKKKASTKPSAQDTAPPKLAALTGLLLFPTLLSTLSNPCDD
jgi:hypothetical protein